MQWWLIDDCFLAAKGFSNLAPDVLDSVADLEFINEVQK
uniref:Uncharacterized protein n=1 Tax=Arundo donax TaxID=35708 RepID=A0A0A9BHV2_ARUDO